MERHLPMTQLRDFADLFAVVFNREQHSQAVQDEAARQLAAMREAQWLEWAAYRTTKLKERAREKVVERGAPERQR